jgi:hypothetical protein
MVTSVVPAADLPESIPSPLVAAWNRALGAWGDGSLHDALLGLAAKHKQYAWLAARYREVSRQRPDDPVPAARLARLQRAALMTMCVEARPAEAAQRKPYRGVSMMLMAFVVATGLGLWLGHVKTQGLQHPPHAAHAAHRSHTR